jgi:RNA polymerase sigma-70 factor (ECF subfamily)
LNPRDERDDAAIVHASLRDPDQFAAIFDRHAPHVHRYLARRLGREAADDLVAETFLIAFGKRKRYDQNRADARPWLYGIATNLISQHRRDEARQLRLRNAIGPDPHVASHAERVVAQVAAQAMGQLLGTALAELSTGDRDVLLLVAWEGLTYDQVATALDIPVGTVRSRLNRARKLVRDVLEVPRDAQKEIRANG